LKRGQTPALPALLLLVVCCALPVRAGLAADAAQDAGAAAPSGFDDLMSHLAASGVVRARFHETRRLQLLEAPLESEGVLYFEPPDRLARRTVGPEPTRLVIDGGRVALRDADGSRVLELGSSDVARYFVDNLGALLRGDAEALRERYSVGYRSDGRDWVLELEPRSPLARRVLAWIRVEGREDVLTGMEVRETSGDATVTVFSDVETGLELTPAERALVFSVDAPDGDP
jgi:outer membrane lipoprotein-sorting protein